MRSLSIFQRDFLFLITQLLPKKNMNLSLILDNQPKNSKADKFLPNRLFPTLRIFKTSSKFLVRMKNAFLYLSILAHTILH
jgi:hypothetical protein